MVSVITFGQNETDKTMNLTLGAETEKYVRHMTPDGQIVRQISRPTDRNYAIKKENSEQASNQADRQNADLLEEKLLCNDVSFLNIV